jgi:hypothetical protein
MDITGGEGVCQPPRQYWVSAVRGPHSPNIPHDTLGRMAKVSDMHGDELNGWVAIAEGKRPQMDDRQPGLWLPNAGAARTQWEPASNWAQGGPIVEREKLTTRFDSAGGGAWVAGYEVGFDDDPFELEHSATGPTLLIAAMRAYVVSKFTNDPDPRRALPQAAKIDARIRDGRN